MLRHKERKLCQIGVQCECAEANKVMRGAEGAERKNR